jgi:hypothetical protein
MQRSSKILLLLLLLSKEVIAQNFGNFASAIYLKNCNTTTFYNTTGSGGNCINPTCATVFDGSSFGSFNQNSNKLEIIGAEIKTWKNGGGNVCSARLNYTVYTTGARPGSPVFTAINLPFKCGCSSGTFADGFGPCGGNDQKWGTVSAGPIDLTNRAPGNYTLEIYYDYTGDDNSSSLCRDTKYINNGGNPTNYTATFSVVASGGACTLLPVELTNFTLNCYDEDVKIAWSTASETRNDYFMVEKSFDGINWTEVQKVIGQGNSSHDYQYSISDDASKIDCYYRLKQVDFDGKVNIFGAVKLECYDDNSSFFEVVPNPNDGVDFEIYLKEKNRRNSSSLNLYDSAGKLIYHQVIEVNSGLNKYQLTENLKAGIYFVEVINDTSYKKTKKIVVF